MSAGSAPPRAKNFSTEPAPARIWRMKNSRQATSRASLNRCLNRPSLRHDGLQPLETLDLGRVTSFPELLRAMSHTAFSGRSLGEAFEVLLAMVDDPDCKVVMTLSGAMTIAKMGKVITKMIDTGMVQAIVS